MTRLVTLVVIGLALLIALSSYAAACEVPQSLIEGVSGLDLREATIRHARSGRCHIG